LFIKYIKLIKSLSNTADTDGHGVLIHPVAAQSWGMWRRWRAFDTQSARPKNPETRRTSWFSAARCPWHVQSEGQAAMRRHYDADNVEETDVDAGQW